MNARQAVSQVRIVAFLLLATLAASAQTLAADPTVTPANPTIGPAKTQMFTAASVSPSSFGSISSLSDGEYHTCALLPNGTAECWGLNLSGQLGDGTTNNSTTPVVVNGLTGATAVSAGGAHTCALLTGGTAECWGDNSWGQLGNGTNNNSIVPTPVPGLTGVIQIVAGYEDTCALLAGGNVQCWGANANSLTPVAVPVAGGGVVQFALAIAGGAGTGGIGGGHMCALLDGGTVDCWGSNIYGQLGGTVSTGAAAMVTNLSGAVAIATGDAHSCALISNGSVECWGWNSWGQVGNGTTNGNDFNPVPQMVIGLGGNAIAIAAGYDHTCALLDNGTAQCWGSEEGGSLGNGVNLTSPPYGQPTPEAVTGLSGATALVAGGSHSCALLVNGSAQCWGSGASLGNGSNALSAVPVTVTMNNLAAQGALHLSSNELALYSCALVAGGSAQCWGINAFGQLGNGTTTNSASPVALSELSGMKTISNSSNAPCAVLTDGSVQCWGHNLYGALGDGTFTDSVTPVQVSGLTGVKTISSGYEFSCAVRSDGTVWCWGLNDQGQLGNGTFTNSGTPTMVSGLSNIKTIGVGYDQVCALGADSSLACWGGNADGQLGIGTVGGGVPTATHLYGVSGMFEISAGTFSTCVLHVSGTAYCWGTNSNGQLGDGDFIDKSSPVGVGITAPAVAIATSAVHSCALAADGTVQCWGFGVDGELGNGAFNTSATPVAVSGLSGVKEIASGGGHDCVLLYNGTVNCWGYGTYGQLGNGVANNSAVPLATLPLVTPLVWTSSMPSIASIDPSSGLASTISDGQTTITATYGTFTGSTLLTVGSIAPVITWSAPAAIPYGTPLSGAQLDASASVPGTFTYTPPLNTVLTGGPQILSATFTPNDLSSYSTVTTTVNLTVLPVIPTITVNGGSFTYDGTPHPATAVAYFVSSNPIAGTFNFTYTPPGNATAPVAAGTYAVIANFISGNPSYTNNSGSGSISIAPAPSSTTITSNTPSLSSTGQAVTIGFKVVGVTVPTGAVTITASTAETCTGTLSAGVGSCVITFNTAGPRTLTAFYAGDPNFTASNSKPSTQTVTGPVCTLSTSNINFNTVASGNIYPGSILAKTITVTNSGTTAMTMNGHLLSIVKGGNSNEFLEVDLCPKSLAAGQSCTIAVTFIAGPYYTEQTATLSVMDNAPGNPQNVALSALVINPQASLSATNLNFGTQTVNTSATKTVTLKNTGTTSLSLTGMSLTGVNATDFTESSTCPSSLGAGNSCVISVAFKPAAKAARSATLKITDNAQSGTQSVTLSGTGR